MGAALSDLPPPQQYMAQCMLSAMKKAPRVSLQRLRVSAGPAAASIPPSVHTFIDYAYRHRDRSVQPQEIDVTDIVAGKQPGWTFYGVGDDLEDSNSGMLEIVRLWEEKCGVQMGVELIE
jgi:hypothetical protein